MGINLNNCHVDTLKIIEKRDTELSSSLNRTYHLIEGTNNLQIKNQQKHRNINMSNQIRSFLYGNLKSELYIVQMHLLNEDKHLPVEDHSDKDIYSSIVKSLELLDVYSDGYALTSESKSIAINLYDQLSKYLKKMPTWYHTLTDEMQK